MGQEMNRGPGNELQARRAEQFPNLRNYTLTPGHIKIMRVQCQPSENWNPLILAQRTHSFPLLLSMYTFERLVMTDNIPYK